MSAAAAAAAAAAEAAVAAAAAAAVGEELSLGRGMMAAMELLGSCCGQDLETLYCAGLCLDGPLLQRLASALGSHLVCLQLLACSLHDSLWAAVGGALPCLEQLSIRFAGPQEQQLLHGALLPPTPPSVGGSQAGQQGPEEGQWGAAGTLPGVHQLLLLAQGLSAVRTQVLNQQLTTRPGAAGVWQQQRGRQLSRGHDGGEGCDDQLALEGCDGAAAHSSSHGCQREGNSSCALQRPGELSWQKSESRIQGGEGLPRSAGCSLRRGLVLELRAGRRRDAERLREVVRDSRVLSWIREVHELRYAHGFDVVPDDVGGVRCLVMPSHEG
ncbi:hypothetical protein V8C86DRAFT_317552 [Haematococcus lacustris]